MTAPGGGGRTARVVNARPSALGQNIQAISDEAAGALSVQIVRREDLPELIDFAIAGDPEAVRVASLVASAVRGIQEAPRRRPMLCAVCPDSLRDKEFSIVAAFPLRDDPARGLALAICHHCAPDRAGAERMAQLALRKIWPDLRSASITHPDGGRA